MGGVRVIVASEVACQIEAGLQIDFEKSIIRYLVNSKNLDTLACIKAEETLIFDVGIHLYFWVRFNLVELIDFIGRAVMYREVLRNIGAINSWVYTGLDLKVKRVHDRLVRVVVHETKCDFEVILVKVEQIIISNFVDVVIVSNVRITECD